MSRKITDIRAKAENKSGGIKYFLIWQSVVLLRDLGVG